jgi:hypothetical protein
LSGLQTTYEREEHTGHNRLDEKKLDTERLTGTPILFFRRDHDDARTSLLQNSAAVTQEIKPIAIGQSHIENDYIIGMHIKQDTRICKSRHRCDLIAPAYQDFAEHTVQAGIIFHEKDLIGTHGSPTWLLIEQALLATG